MTRQSRILPREERCQEDVAGSGPWGSFHTHQCEKRATVVRGGKRYCKVHDPEYIAKKRDARSAQWEKRNNRRRIEMAGPMLLKACKDALEASHNPVVERILMAAIKKAERDD